MHEFLSLTSIYSIAAFFVLFVFVCLFLGVGVGMFNMHNCVWFFYVFWASIALDLDFTAHRICHSIKHLNCACMCSSEVSLLSHALYYGKIWWYRKIFSWFQTNFLFHSHKSNGVNPYQYCHREVSYFIQIYDIVFGEHILFFVSIILKRYPLRSIPLATQKQSITIDYNNF